MSKKSLTKNYIFNLCYQILTLIAPLLTTPYISGILGAGRIGIVSYAESIVAYFTMFASLSINIYGQREISYVQDDIEKRSVVFWNTKLLSLCTTSVVLVLYLVFSLKRENSVLYLILALNILSVAADVTWFFQGIEDFFHIVCRNAIFKGLNILYVFLFIKTAEDIYWYAFGHGFFLLASNLSLWWKLSEYVKKIKWQQLHPLKDIRVILALFVPTIATQLYTVLDKTMIGLITQDFFENGYYEQALKIERMVLTVITALGTIMTPRIGYHYQKNDMVGAKRLMLQSYRFTWFLGVPLCFGMIMVSGHFVPWFFGVGFDQVAILLRILAWLILAIGISNVTGVQYLVPTQRHNIQTKAIIGGSCINFTLNIFLIKEMGAMGAAIASVTAEVAIAVAQLCFIRRELPPIKVLTLGIPYFIAGTAMAVGLYFLGEVQPATICGTAILVISGALIYFTVLVLLKDSFVIPYIKKAWTKLVGKEM